MASKNYKRERPHRSDVTEGEVILFFILTFAITAFLLISVYL